MTFKKQKFSLNALLSICLTFCHFEPGVAFKSGAYKKACSSQMCLIVLVY